jgi:F420-non-reducing hydrogenase iron-sulfur subunit
MKFSLTKAPKVRYAQREAKSGFFSNETTVLSSSSLLRDHSRSFSVPGGQWTDRILSQTSRNWQGCRIIPDEKAQKVLDKTWQLMKLLGIEDTRLRREWISASEGTRFAEVIRDFTDEVRRLGPNPLVKRETAA